MKVKSFAVELRRLTNLQRRQIVHECPVALGRCQSAAPEIELLHPLFQRPARPHRRRKYKNSRFRRARETAALARKKLSPHEQIARHQWRWCAASRAPGFRRSIANGHRWKAGCDCPLSRSNACAPESRDRWFASRAHHCRPHARAQRARSLPRQQADHRFDVIRQVKIIVRQITDHVHPRLAYCPISMWLAPVTRVSDSRKTAPGIAAGQRRRRRNGRLGRSVAKNHDLDVANRLARRSPHRAHQGRTMIMRRDDDRRLDRHNALLLPFDSLLPTIPAAARSGTECSRSRSGVDRRRARRGRRAAWAC